MLLASIMALLKQPPFEKEKADRKARRQEVEAASGSSGGAE